MKSGHFKILTIKILLTALMCLNYVSLSCINGTSVQNPEQCTFNNDETSYCCVLASPGAMPTTQMCMNMNKNNYIGQTTYIYNNTRFKLNCNATVVPVEGGPCGNPNPIFASDCWTVSTEQDSCCFYYQNNVTKTGSACIWYDGKYSGNKTSKDGKLQLACNSELLKLNFLLLLLLVIFI